MGIFYILLEECIMTLRKAIVVDVDDTILDFGSRVREFFNHHHGKLITGKSLDWDLCEWLDIEKGQDREVLEAFMGSWQCGALDGLPGARRVLTKLVQQGYDIFCVTACGLDPQVHALRKANLYHVFGDIFEEIKFVGFNESKVTAIQEIAMTHTIDLFVDDKYQNISDVMDAGYDSCILLKQPHTRPYRQEAICAHDWYEISAMLQDWNHTQWSIR